MLIGGSAWRSGHLLGRGKRVHAPHFPAICKSTKNHETNEVHRSKQQHTYPDSVCTGPRTYHYYDDDVVTSTSQTRVRMSTAPSGTQLPVFSSPVSHSWSFCVCLSDYLHHHELTPASKRKVRCVKVVRCFFRSSHHATSSGDEYLS